jgi:hypothetical protein
MKLVGLTYDPHFIVKVHYPSISSDLKSVGTGTSDHIEIHFSIFYF